MGRCTMNGFITESVSKISDGFGSAIKLLAFVLLTTLAVIPIKTYLGLTGILCLLGLLLILAAYYFYSSLRHQVNDTKKAWCGMAAGVLLWQITRFLPEVPGMGWLDRIGWVYWIGLALITVLLWKRFLPIGSRFLLLTFLLNWIGRLYLASIDSGMLSSGFFAPVYANLRYLGLAGIVVSIWWIVTRSRNSVERKYGGLALYFSVLLTFLIF